MLCENCYTECMRIIYSLQGKTVMLNALHCLTGECNKDMHKQLCELIRLRREERWKKHDN